MCIVKAVSLSQKAPCGICIQEDAYVGQIRRSWSDWRLASDFEWHQGTAHSPWRAIHSCRSRSLRSLQRRDALTHFWQCTGHYLQQLNKAQVISGRNDNSHKKTCGWSVLAQKLVWLQGSRLTVTAITCFIVLARINIVPIWTHKQRSYWLSIAFNAG